MGSITPIWLLIAGPSGVGKTTLVNKLLAAYPDELLPVVTATTRPKRLGERDAVEYFFMTEQEFSRREAAGEFFETIARNNIRYGTLVSEIQGKLACRKSLVMHIDWAGARKIRQWVANRSIPSIRVVSVFLRAESMEALHQRLVKRGRNTPEQIAQRLALARKDLAHVDEFDHSFISDTPQRDFERVSLIYKKARDLAR